MASGSAAGALAAAETPPAVSDAPAEPVLAAALQVAKVHHHRVEISSVGSETTTTFANPDGTLTATITPHRSRWQDAVGSWHNIDLSLVAQPDGTLAPVSEKPSRHLRLPVRADQAVAFATPAGNFTVTHPSVTAAIASLAASVRTATAGVVMVPLAAAAGAGGGRTFVRVLAGRSLTEQATVDGFEETVTLTDATQAGSYTDVMTVPAGVTARQAGVGVEFVAADGTVTADLSGGVAHDSTPTPSGDGAETQATSSLVSQVGSAVTINVSIDDAWLHDPSRDFPVLIDPSFYQDTSANGSGAIDTYVQSDGNGPTITGLDPTLLRVGYGFGANGTSVARTLIRFNFNNMSPDGTHHGPIAGIHVLTSNFHIVGWDASSCTPHPVAVLGLGASFTRSNPATVWTNQPPTDGLGGAEWSAPFAQAFTGTGACAYGNGDDMSIQHLVQRWFGGFDPMADPQAAPANPETNYGLRLTTDETSVDGWKKFGSGETGGAWSPALSVTYNVNNQPNTPTLSCDSCTARSTPALHASGIDPDGDVLGYVFQIFRNDGSGYLMIQECTCSGDGNFATTYTPGGVDVGWRVPPNLLRTGVPYEAVVFSADHYAWSPVSAPVVWTGAGGPASAPTGVLTTAANGETGTVHWSNPPADDGGSPVQTYAVTAIDAFTCDEQTQSVAASPNVLSPSATFSNLNEDSFTGVQDDYVYAVSAINSSGGSARGYSSTSGPPTCAPTAPVAVAASAIVSGQATVTWSPPANDGGSPITDYEVTESATGTAVSVPSSARSVVLTVPTLPEGDSYSFSVTADNQVGAGDSASADGYLGANDPGTGWDGASQQGALNDGAVDGSGLSGTGDSVLPEALPENVMGVQLAGTPKAAFQVDGATSFPTGGGTLDESSLRALCSDPANPTTSTDPTVAGSACLTDQSTGGAPAPADVATGAFRPQVSVSSAAALPSACALSRSLDKPIMVSRQLACRAREFKGIMLVKDSVYLPPTVYYAIFSYYVLTQTSWNSSNVLVSIVYSYDAGDVGGVTLITSARCGASCNLSGSGPFYTKYFPGVGTVGTINYTLRAPGSAIETVTNGVTVSAWSDDHEVAASALNLPDDEPFRCDSSAYRTRYGPVRGCVFSRYPAVDHESVSNSDYGQAAAHIQTAQAVAGAHHFGLLGNPYTLPTSNYEPQGQPLTRETSILVQAWNRSAACPRGKFRPSCDEYPFASTDQGCSFFERPDCQPTGMDLRQNTMQGNHLGQFYYQNRVLDQEQFWVVTTP